MSKKGMAGRPSIMGEKQLLKLEQAFALGCTDAEACLFAEIGKTALYNYQNAHPEFADRKQELKKTPVLKARKRVVESLEDDTGTARWFLERRQADEFAPQKQINLDVTHKLDDKQLLEAYKQALQQIPEYQQDVIEAEIVTPELMHNPYTDDD